MNIRNLIVRFYLIYFLLKLTLSTYEGNFLKCEQLALYRKSISIFWVILFWLKSMKEQKSTIIVIGKKVKIRFYVLKINIKTR